MKRAIPKTEPASPQAADWHLRVAQVAGGLSLAIVRRSIPRTFLLECAKTLQEVGEQMEERARS